MIAADTSTWIAFFEGEAGNDVEFLDRALRDRHVLMVPPVLTELLSDPGMSAELSKILVELPLVDLKPGFWERAGALRSRVLARQRKARLGDALIAQCCVDAGIPLLTRDRDFRAFAGTAALELLVDFGQNS